METRTCGARLGEMGLLESLAKFFFCSARVTNLYTQPVRDTHTEPRQQLSLILWLNGKLLTLPCTSQGEEMKKKHFGSTGMCRSLHLCKYLIHQTANRYVCM